MLSSYVVTHSTIVIPWTFTRNLQVVGFQSYPPRSVLPGRLHVTSRWWDFSLSLPAPCTLGIAWTFTRNLQMLGFQSIPPGTCTLGITWTFTRNLQVVGFQSIPPGTLHARYGLDVYT